MQGNEEVLKGTDTMEQGIAGSIIMDATSLFFMGGILVYTSLYRQRGRMDDKLYFAMLITNIILAAADGVTYMLEGNMVIAGRTLMAAGNTAFFASFEIFAYLYLLYIDFRVYRNDERLRKIKIAYGIPCFLILSLLLVNLKTGWIFSVGENNNYLAGPYNDLVFLPVAFYFVVSLILIRLINVRLVFLGLLLIVTRVAWGVWFRDISSTAFTYTLFLACTHIHVMNQPLYEEAP